MKTAGKRRGADELQIQIDDVYACPGSCAGCALTFDERKVTKPDMEPETLALAFSRLREYVPTLEGLECINLSYAIADHLTMPDGHLEDLHREATSFLVDTGFAGPRSTVFFSTSLIGKPEKVLPRLELLAGFGGPAKFIPIAVLDPAKLQDPGYGKDYETLILGAKRIFGAVDLTVNLSVDAIRRLTPEFLHGFAADAGFREVTLNWAPTGENLAKTVGDPDELSSWLIAYDRIARKAGRLESSFGPVALRAIDAVRCGWEDPTSIGAVEAAAAIVPETIRKSIEISHTGDLMAKFEAVGDVPHAPRFGYPIVGNLKNGSISDLLDKAMPRIVAEVGATHAASRACSRCPHAAPCAATGYHVYTRGLGARAARAGRAAEECPHVGRALLDYFSSIARDPAAA